FERRLVLEAWFTQPRRAVDQARAHDETARIDHARRLPPRWSSADRCDLSGRNKKRCYPVDSLRRIDHPAVLDLDFHDIRGAGPRRGCSPAFGGSEDAKRRAWGSIIRGAGPRRGCSPAFGGSEDAKRRAWGSIIRGAGPSQAANCSPAGGSAAPKAQAWGSISSYR